MKQMIGKGSNIDGKYVRGNSACKWHLEKMCNFALPFRGDPPCGCGVIGSRARLRILCLRAWGFESLHPHKPLLYQLRTTIFMNITKESTGILTALLKIEIGPADYTATVEKQIADYKRKANIPGFRPGHIPTGLIKKMYGKTILADEVNKLISDNLVNFIRDEKIDILGNPLPNMEKNSAIDFENY